MPEKSRPSVRTFALAGLLLVLLAGCPGVLPEAESRYRDSGSAIGTGGMMGAATGGTTGEACDAPMKVFQRDSKAGGCLGSICHLTTAIAPDLQSANVKSRLATMMSAGGTANGMNGLCKGDLLVNTANPSASVLLKRVQGTDCGDRMPDLLFDPSLTYLNQADLDCVSAWVMAP